MNGSRIRQLRLSQGFTLMQMAEQTGYTASFISQIERNLRQPSLASLRKIADFLGCSVVWILMEDDPTAAVGRRVEQEGRDGPCIRRTERRIITMPEIDVHYEILTPTAAEGSFKPRMTGMYVKLKPGQWISEKEIRHHEVEESVLLLQGSMEAHLGGKVYALGPGDSLFIPADVLHNFRNAGEDELAAVVYFSAYIL